LICCLTLREECGREGKGIEGKKEKEMERRDDESLRCPRWK